MQEARIELLQRMPIFGGIRTEILQFLLALCPIVSVPTNEFFFREDDQGDSMFVLEMGKSAVVKSWRGQDYLLQTLKEGDCFGEMAVMDHCPRSASVRAVEDCIAIRISAADLYEVYAQDLKQFALSGISPSLTSRGVLSAPHGERIASGRRRRLPAHLPGDGAMVPG